MIYNEGKSDPQWGRKNKRPRHKTDDRIKDTNDKERHER